MKKKCKSFDELSLVLRVRGLTDVLQNSLNTAYCPFGSSQIGSVCWGRAKKLYLTFLRHSSKV